MKLNKEAHLCPCYLMVNVVDLFINNFQIFFLVMILNIHKEILN
jgi:hypothetical protein